MQRVYVLRKMKTYLIEMSPMPVKSVIGCTPGLFTVIWTKSALVVQSVKVSIYYSKFDRNENFKVHTGNLTL